LKDEQTRLIGVLYPHQGVYQAVATIDPTRGVSAKLDVKEIAAGKFAVLSVAGSVAKTFNAMKDFTSRWLPDSGYGIADISGFETFSTNPAIIPYADITRDVHIRIEPAI